MDARRLTNEADPDEERFSELRRNMASTRSVRHVPGDMGGYFYNGESTEGRFTREDSAAREERRG